MSARSASTVMQFAPFHQPQVSQIPEDVLYHDCRTSRAVSARERGVDWAVVVVVRRVRLERRIGVRDFIVMDCICTPGYMVGENIYTMQSLRSV